MTRTAQPQRTFIQMVLSTFVSVTIMVLLVWCFGLDYVKAQNAVSCSGRDKNSNKLYKAEWTVLPTAPKLPSFDFFLCRWDTSHQTWLAYTFNCTGSRQGDMPTQKYCNFFSESTQKCDLDKTTVKCL